ncbi:MAG: adenylyl-sulfate reductase [Acidiferrobacteraceae bacterium]|nr:adenylyl-sulfate reductase [Acidiferrobacteraceae bacterium]|tara:strand:- start:595 stop:1380 length:786 start_codon:yes stop_codon:yes gene_type:complete
MFSVNPFAEASNFVPPVFMQTYLVIMVVLVAGGTIFDILHKGSAKYFFQNWQAEKKRGVRAVGIGETLAIVAKSIAIDAVMSGEFCNIRRRVAHLFTMYGFLIYIGTTVIMVFGYSTATSTTPALLPILWYIGGALLCVGGYWFWFFIRVDVAAEGRSPFRVMHADLFILALLVSVTLGLVWGCVQAVGASWSNVVLVFYLIATVVLFGSIPWSKFSHMFFKPAAAIQKRVADAGGSRSNLPPPVDTPEVFGSTRRLPRHY